jgi:prevent-host-death family protein
MPETYTAYEAKTKLGEILRKVRSGQRILISYHGEEVAEIRPLAAKHSLKARLRRHKEQGTLSAATAKSAKLKPVVRKRGALERFLESRD